MTNPVVIGRAQWNANPVNTPAGSIAVPTPNVWLHHTGSTGLGGASGMRSLQSHARSTGYVDIQYNFVVDVDGQIYEARGGARDSAATGGGQNSTSHAICAFGDYTRQQPTDALLRAIASLLPWMRNNGWIRNAQITGPHQAAPGNSTACCGTNLIARIGDINAMVGSGGTGPAPTPPTKKGNGAVELVSTPSGNGYYIVDSGGAVFAYGDAKYHGGANTLNGGKGPNAPIVGMDVMPNNAGYWLLGQDGGVFAYGNAKFFGAPTGKVS